MASITWRAIDAKARRSSTASMSTTRESTWARTSSVTSIGVGDPVT
jgi:hypothetical protein